MEDSVMAAGGYVKYNIWGEGDYLGKSYWLWQSEEAYKLIKRYPTERWEQLMYFYLFKWAGYEE